SHSSVTVVQGSRRGSGQRTHADRRRVPAGKRRSGAYASRAVGRLRTGGQHRDAGQRRDARHTGARPDLLPGPGPRAGRRPKREPDRAGQVAGVPGEGQRRTDSDASEMRHLMTLSDIEATLTGDGAMTKYTGGRDRPSCDEIARLAYHFYETRGRRDGQDVGDWLAAERELAHHYR